MSLVDLSEKDSLLKARDKVLQDKTGNSYVIYGYAEKGNSNKLIVEVEDESEDGGIQGMIDEFNSSSIQYGLATIKTDRGTKSLMIMWQGDGSPVLRKSACAHHQADITRLLNPTATYTARSELELDIDNIMEVFN